MKRMRAFTPLLKDLFPTIRLYVPAKSFTTFGVGGTAKYFLRITDTSSLVETVRLLRRKRIPYYLIAGGSNLIFPDGVFQKLIICIETRKFVRFDRMVTVSAGLPLAVLIKKSIGSGLAGLESLSGIPGSVGGAIVGNAGAYGQAISDHLVRVRIFDGRLVRWVSKSYCAFSYRESIFKKKKFMILDAQFRLRPGNKTRLLQHANKIVALRSKKYKKGLRCPGSFFKNVLVDTVSQRSLAKVPPEKIIDGKIPAGYLLEVVGAKGLCQGKICIASFHGNLLVNCGGARSCDVRGLAEILKERVRRTFGIKLEEEVRYVV